MNLRSLLFTPLFQSTEAVAREKWLDSRVTNGIRHIFQPIVGLECGGIFGYEALLRPLKGESYENAGELLSAAKTETPRFALDMASVEKALLAWEHEIAINTMFLNIHATTLIRLLSERSWNVLTNLMHRLEIAPHRLVFEITKHRQISDDQVMREAANHLKQLGFRICIDDFAGVQSDVRLWSHVEPHFVKLDARLTSNVASDPRKTQNLLAFARLTRKSGSRLIAKNIETEADLLAIQQAGVGLGQGFYLGSPDKTTISGLNQRAFKTLRSGVSIPAEVL